MNIEAWLQTAEGRAAIEKAIERARATVARLEEARRVPTWMWHERVTI